MLPASCALVAAAVAVGPGRISQRVRSQHRWGLGREIGIGAVALAGLVVFLLVGRATVAMAALLIVATVSWVARDMARRRTSRVTEEILAGFLGSVGADLHAGASVPQALARASELLPERAPAEVRRALAATAVLAARGGSVAAGLAEHPSLAPIGRVCAVSEHHGIPLASLIEQAQARIDAARRHRAATAASLQGPQATAVVLSCLPFAGIAMGGVMDANPAGFLFGGGLGGLLLDLGVGLVCAGFAWSRWIISKVAG